MPAKLFLSRKNLNRSGIRAYKVFIDGEQMGKVSNNKTEEFDLVPGKHTVMCKVNWCGSQEYEIDVKEDDTVYLRVRSGMKYYELVYWFMTILVITRFFLRLNRETMLDLLYIFDYLIIIPVAYFIYYITFGRKKFLVVEKDKDNVFAS